MVNVSVEIDPKERRELERLFKRMPTETRRAYGLACSIVVRRMRRRMNPRNHELAPWDDFTKRLRGLLPFKAVFGGRLFDSPKKITMYQKGDSTVIGWVGSMEAAAVKFQDGGSEPTNFGKRYKRYMMARGIPHAMIPKVANTPARPVVEPVAREAASDFGDWVLGALAKILEGKIAGNALKYEKSPSTDKGYRAAKGVAEGMVSLAQIREIAERFMGDAQGAQRALESLHNKR